MVLGVSWQEIMVETQITWPLWRFWPVSTLFYQLYLKQYIISKYACLINIKYWSNCKDHNSSIRESRMLNLKRKPESSFHWWEMKWSGLHGSLVSAEYYSGTWLSNPSAWGHRGPGKARKSSMSPASPLNAHWVLNMQISKYKKQLPVTGAIKWCYYLVMVLFWRLKIWYNDAILM